MFTLTIDSNVLDFAKNFVKKYNNDKNNNENLFFLKNCKNYCKCESLIINDDNENNKKKMKDTLIYYDTYLTMCNITKTFNNNKTYLDFFKKKLNYAFLYLDFNYPKNKYSTNLIFNNLTFISSNIDDDDLKKKIVFILDNASIDNLNDLKIKFPKNLIIVLKNHNCLREDAVYSFLFKNINYTAKFKQLPDYYENKNNNNTADIVFINLYNYFVADNDNNDDDDDDNNDDDNDVDNDRNFKFKNLDCIVSSLENK